MLEIGALHEWFEENQREFPWRRERTPYRVWVSEVMLQQTRAAVVIPYFLRWMEQFPDVEALARAPLERVIKAWEGLGYYSRARNLHRGAKEIVERFGGEIVEEALEAIPGVGSYTRGAILSFGFHKRAPAIDGNVRRVISRLYCIEKGIEEKVEVLLDEKEPWVTSEALIELGATVCLRKPLCEECPLQKECLAFQTGKAEYFPLKNREIKVTVLHRVVAILLDGDQVLVKKGKKGSVMADLYEFPYFEREVGREILGMEVEGERNLSSVSHTFTRFKAHLYPRVFRVKQRKEADGCEWVAIDHLPQLPFSSGHRKILKEL